MKQKTQTTIGRLRRGDRFYFISDKKKQVHQLDSFSGDKAHFVKVLNDKASDSWMFKRSVSSNKEVIFLRHTLLQVGDECFLQDLRTGDRFYQPGDGTREFEIMCIEQHGVKLFDRKQPFIPLYSHPLSKGVIIGLAPNPKHN